MISQGGTAEEDRLYGILPLEDNSMVLTGRTSGVWGAVHYGDADFAAVKLDENQAELWRWQVMREISIFYPGVFASVIF